MDPNVGGKIHAVDLRLDKEGMIIQPFDDAELLSKEAKEEIFTLLHD
jgi:hypothetical protein